MKAVLEGAANAALDGVCEQLGLPSSHLHDLVGTHEESVFSAMRYDDESSGDGLLVEEHEDRGMLTLIVGPGVETLEVYDEMSMSKSYPTLRCNYRLHRVDAEPWSYVD